MSFDQHVNFGYGTVAVAPSPALSGGAMTLAAGSVVPAVPFDLLIAPVGVAPLVTNSEIVRVTAMTGLAITAMTRGMYGTSPRSILVGDQCFNGVTKEVITAIEAATLASPGLRPSVMLGIPGTSTPALVDFTGFNTLIAPRAIDLMLLFGDIDTAPLLDGSSPGWAAQLNATIIQTLSPSVHKISDFTAGAFDTSGLNAGGLAGLAAAAVSYGKPLIVRLAHEFNGDFNGTYGYTKETAAQFVAGWQHIVNTFRAHGATNVLWMWCPNVWNTPGASAQHSIDPTVPDSSGVTWYPGDAYVDIVGLDGYMMTSNTAVNTPEDLFLANYKSVCAIAPSKPFAIGEVGVAAQSRLSSLGGKSGWYELLFQMVQSDMPRCIFVNQWQRSAGPDDTTISSSGSDSAAAAKFVAHANSFPMIASAATLPTISDLAAERATRAAADALLAPLASPALTGNPTAPTQTAGNNSTRLATTAYADGGVLAEAIARAAADALLDKALVPTAVKTGAYNAAAGDLVPVDATTGPVTITLPTAPADKTRITIKKMDASANLVTVARGGSDLFNTAGGSTTLILTLKFQSTSLQYSSAIGIWYVVTGELSLSQLDARYDAAGAATAEGVTRAAADSLLAPFASPALTGSPTAPTKGAGDNSTHLATTAYADGAVATEVAARSAAITLVSSTFVMADNSVPNGTSDNTAYLNGLLTTAIAAGKTLLIPWAPNSWVLSHWTLPSNTNVNATGATFVQPASTNTLMIRNTSLSLGTPGSARDSNITWVGGTFVKGAGQQNVGSAGALSTGLDDHCTMFGFVDGLYVRNMIVNQSGTGGNAGTGGRYGCYVWNCTSAWFTDYAATSASQSVNQSTLQFAYCSGFHVKGVTGTFGDDMVAVVNGNATGDLLANGAAATENYSIEDIFGTSPSTGVKIAPGSTTANTAPFYNISRGKILNVRGNFGSRGGTGAVYIGGSGTYANLQGGSVQGCHVESVTQTRAATTCVYVTAAAESHGIVIDACNNQQDSAAILIDTSGGSAHCSVKVQNCDFTTAITSGSYFPISITGSTCRTLELDNCRINAATTGTATVGFVNAATGPGWLVATNCRGTGRVLLLGLFTSTTRIAARGCEQEDANGQGWGKSDTGSVITICDWANNFFGGSNTWTQTAGTLSVKNNATSFPGANGTAVLIAGTVTVTPGSGMCSTTSQFRLQNIATGGTAGAANISARGATTFTITSTNAADTSSIFWEIVNS